GQDRRSAESEMGFGLAQMGAGARGKAGAPGTTAPKRQAAQGCGRSTSTASLDSETAPYLTIGRRRVSQLRCRQRCYDVQNNENSGPLNQVFPVTRFTDKHARTKREEDWGLPGLVQLIQGATAPTKARLALLKLARFGDTPGPGGSLRHDANVI